MYLLCFSCSQHCRPFRTEADCATNFYLFKRSIYAVTTSLEATEISYGGTSALPSTTLTFKQLIGYSSIDPVITTRQIATRPFSTTEYRQDYVDFLKIPLADSFSQLDSVPDSGVSQTGSSSPTIPLADSLFCGTKWPVDCDATQPCHDNEDCPSGQHCLIDTSCAVPTTADAEAEPMVQQSAAVPAPSPETSPFGTVTSSDIDHSACNICMPNQIGINGQVNFNGELTACVDVYNFMAKHYKDGSDNCVAAQQALGSTCCQDAADTATTTTDSTTEDAEPIVQQSATLQRPVPTTERPVRPGETASSPQSSQTTTNDDCNICMPNQIGTNGQVNFNGKLTSCEEVYDFMQSTFKEGSVNCIGAQQALGSSCCQDLSEAAAVLADEPNNSSQTISFSIANTQFDMSAAGDEVGDGERIGGENEDTDPLQNWRVRWEDDAKSSSSTHYASLLWTAIASCISFLLCTAL